VAARFQVNILVQPIKGIMLYENIPRTFFPMIWFEQHVVMTQDISAEIAEVLSLPFKGQFTGFLLLVLGLIILLFLPIKNLVYRCLKVNQIRSIPAEEPIHVTYNEKKDEKSEEISLIGKQYLDNSLGKSNKDQTVLS
jgi:hypothetical protein